MREHELGRSEGRGGGHEPGGHPLGEGPPQARVSPRPCPPHAAASRFLSWSFSISCGSGVAGLSGRRARLGRRGRGRVADGQAGRSLCSAASPEGARIPAWLVKHSSPTGSQSLRRARTRQLQPQECL